MSTANRSRMLRQRGFSLVEVLVAMVVLSVGLLGIAALYVESLRAGKSALTRSEAVILAADMADRIRANPDAKDKYTKLEDAVGTITAGCNPAGGGCTKEEMAANDIAQWSQLVDDRYDDPSTGRLAPPNGRGTIGVVNGVDLTVYTIGVSWTEVGQAATDKNTYTLEFRL